MKVNVITSLLIIVVHYMEKIVTKSYSDNREEQELVRICCLSLDVEDWSDSVECLLLKRESNADFFFLFCPRIAWCADTHLIICHATKELQSMFGSRLSKMAVTVEMCLWHLLCYQMMCLVAQSGWWCPRTRPFFL